MLGEDRACDDVLIQLADVQGALRAIAHYVLACHLTDALGAVSNNSRLTAATITNAQITEKPGPAPDKRPGTTPGGESL